MATFIRIRQNSRSGSAITAHFCVPQPVWFFFGGGMFSTALSKSYEWIPPETLVENVIWHRSVFGGFKISH